MKDKNVMACPIKKILISQPAPATDNSPYYAIAEKYKLTLDFKQLIKVVTLDPMEFRKQRISILDHTAVIFSSRGAIDHFFSLSQEMRLSVPETMKYFCISESVAHYLQKYIVYRKRKVFFPETGKLDGLIQSITKHNKETFIAPVAEEHSTDLFSLLDEKKISYNKAVMYRTVSREWNLSDPLDHDMIVFFSPMGVQSLFTNFPEFQQGKTLILSSGPQTSKAVEEAGLRLDHTLTIPGQTLSITSALDEYLSKLK